MINDFQGKNFNPTRIGQHIKSRIKIQFLPFMAASWHHFHMSKNNLLSYDDIALKSTKIDWTNSLFSFATLPYYIHINPLVPNGPIIRSHHTIYFSKVSNSEEGIVNHATTWCPAKRQLFLFFHPILFDKREFSKLYNKQYYYICPIWN